MDLQPRKKVFEMGGHTFTLETGRVARQATGSVLVTCGDTSVLGTVVGVKEAKPGQPFFPLTVNYSEKNLRCGQNPGWFLQARRSSFRERNPDLPSDRPSYPSSVPQRLHE